ncbi:unnamed protein product [Rhizophagus irregularis]|nr:unnamed protein product [Rhizophagus irregularis]
MVIFISGNLLLLTHAIAYISDLGLSRPADKPNKSNEHLWNTSLYLLLKYYVENHILKLLIYSFRYLQGLRPRAIDDTEPEYVKLMKNVGILTPNREPVPENELFVKNHQKSFYISRKFNYSARLNEVLSQELSSKIITYRYNDDYSDENNSNNYEEQLFNR